jgi:type II secretory pathway pseudopilin PulG
MATAKRETQGERTRTRRFSSGEEGYILIAVLFMVVLVLIALSLAAPKVAADLERDREVELMHRGKQYQRAIQLYYRKFQRYPPNMEGLEKTNEIRFLRRRYVDPITRKDEWHLIHFGEQKTPIMGFFGQAIGGAGTVAGTGPGGAFQWIGTPIGGAATTDPNATTPANPAAPGATTDPNNPAGAQGGQNGQTGTTGGSIFGSSSTTGNGPTIGGGGIIGVESTSPKLAILEYKKKTHFNEWEFYYDPAADRMSIIGNAGTIGQPIGTGNSGAPGFPSTPGGGNQAPITPVPPAPTPQQQ